MKKKLLASVLTATMVASALVGCSGSAQTSEATTQGGADAQTTTAAAGETTEAESITVMLYDRGDEFQSGMSVTDNALTQLIQEKVLEEKNVKVEFVSVPRSEADSKLNAMMAGGNAPDIVFTYDRNLFTNYATEGGLAVLKDSVDANGPTIMSELGEEFLQSGVIDGSLYAVPKHRGYNVVRHLGYIRKDWLDTLGMEVPTTTAELEAALYAFKEQDPGQVGDKLVPWAMGGNATAIRYFQTFVTSYVSDLFGEENLWTYQEDYAVLHPEAKEGFRELNKLYNDGIITKDFAVDTANDKYVQDISNGYAGFVLDDDIRPLGSGWFATSGGEWAPVNCFTGSGTEYQGNVANPDYGMYVMVPKASEEKVDACIKYLDWLADPQNVLYLSNINQEVDELGFPVVLPTDEKIATGYPITSADFNIVNGKLEALQTVEDKVAELSSKSEQFGKDFGDEFYSAVATALAYEGKQYPAIPQAMPEGATYGKVVSELCVQLGYRSISVPVAEFDATYDAEYQKVVDAGWDKMLEELQTYYNENVK